MARTPFPVFLQKFARAFGPPLLVVATAGLLGALKAPPQPPSPTQSAAPQPEVIQKPCADPPSPGRIVVEDGVIYGDNLRYTAFFGNYRARYYGLKMRIPDGLIGFDGGASHHGFHIPLDVQEGETLDQIWERHSNRQPPPFIGLYFEYNASMIPFEENQPEGHPDVVVLHRKNVRIAGMHGWRLVTKEKNQSGDFEIFDELYLGRRFPGGNTVDEKGRRIDDAFYSFYLRTTEKRYKEDVKVFEKILKTWRTFDE